MKELIIKQIESYLEIKLNINQKKELFILIDTFEQSEIKTCEAVNYFHSLSDDVQKELKNYLR